MDLRKEKEKIALARLSDAMLKWSGPSGNEAMTPSVVGHINIIDKEHSFSGSQEAAVVFVEWKVPSFEIKESVAKG
jgi:hypothetical protein